jgi:hypothetical protein
MKDTQHLPTELQRIRYLADRLNSALSAQKKFNLPKVLLDPKEAEELLAIICDSIKTLSSHSELFEVNIPNEQKHTPRISAHAKNQSSHALLE